MSLPLPTVLHHAAVRVHVMWPSLQYCFGHMAPIKIWQKVLACEWTIGYHLVNQMRLLAGPNSRYYTYCISTVHLWEDLVISFMKTALYNCLKYSQAWNHLPMIRCGTNIPLSLCNKQAISPCNSEANSTETACKGPIKAQKKSFGLKLRAVGDTATGSLIATVLLASSTNTPSGSCSASTT